MYKLAIILKYLFTSLNKLCNNFILQMLEIIKPWISYFFTALSALAKNKFYNFLVLLLAYK